MNKFQRKYFLPNLEEKLAPWRKTGVRLRKSSFKNSKISYDNFIHVFINENYMRYSCKNKWKIKNLLTASILQLTLNKDHTNFLTNRFGKNIGQSQYKTKQCQRRYVNYLCNTQCIINYVILLLVLNYSALLHNFN
jgi:hypothetical protein